MNQRNVLCEVGGYTVHRALRLRKIVVPNLYRIGNEFFDVRDFELTGSASIAAKWTGEEFHIRLIESRISKPDQVPRPSLELVEVHATMKWLAFKWIGKTNYGRRLSIKVARESYSNDKGHGVWKAFLQEVDADDIILFQRNIPDVAFWDGLVAGNDSVAVSLMSKWTGEDIAALVHGRVKIIGRQSIAAAAITQMQTDEEEANII